MSYNVNFVESYGLRCCAFCGSSTECDCLARIACASVGQPAHRACGWCTVHGGPRFECLDSCAHWMPAKVFEVSGSSSSRWYAQLIGDSAGVYGTTPREAWQRLQRKRATIRAANDQTKEFLLPAPIDVVITCPACATLHLDEGEWKTRVHKTHQCQACKLEWRPFEVPTVGVERLP